MNTSATENIKASDNVKSCRAKIKAANGTDFFIDNFYQLMFSHHPETLSFFPANLSEQKTTLLATLDNVINGIEYITELENEILALGLRHKDIGINKEIMTPF